MHGKGMGRQVKGRCGWGRKEAGFGRKVFVN